MKITSKCKMCLVTSFYVEYTGVRMNISPTLASSDPQTKYTRVDEDTVNNNKYINVNGISRIP